MKSNYRYHKCNTEVILSDKIKLKGWFRKREGIVVYVPGISKLNKFFGEARQGDNLEELGIELQDGTIYGIFIDPEKNIVRENIYFLKRGKPKSCGFPEKLDDDFIPNY